jgi:multidrug resistance efflux pump
MAHATQDGSLLSRLIGWMVAALLGAVITFAVVTLRNQPAPVVSTPAPTTPVGLLCIGYVDAETGVIPLLAQQAGRVVTVHVQENEQVSAGRPLISLDSAAAKSAVEEASAAVELAKLKVKQAGELSTRHTTQIDTQKAAIDAMVARRDAARKLADAQKQLRMFDRVSEAEVAAAEEKVKEIDAGVRAEEAKLREMLRTDFDLEIRLAKQQESQAVARLRQANLLEETMTITAPADGQVYRILVGPGTLVSPQSGACIYFAAEGSRVVRAYVEQEFASRLAEGRKVEVTDPSMPNSKWRGTVARIAHWFGPRRILPGEIPAANEARTVECLIRLEPSSTPPRIGQKMDVLILPSE